MILVRSEQPAAVNGRVDDWLTPGRFAVLLVSLLLACFPLIVAGLEAFTYGDAGQFAYPVAFYHREAFWRGELPLWNPSSSCGIPFLAQWNTLVLYPPSLFYVLFPLPWSFGVFCLGHLFLGGMGMYLLAHRYVGNRLAAAVAGTAFAFNGLTWYGIMWPQIIAALAWMPWTVMAMGCACRAGGRMIALAAIAAAMQLLSGGAEVVLQTWMILGVFWLANLFCRDAEAAARQIGADAGGGGRRDRLAWFGSRGFAVEVDRKIPGGGNSGGGAGRGPTAPVPGFACSFATQQHLQQRRHGGHRRHAAHRLA